MYLLVYTHRVPTRYTLYQHTYMYENVYVHVKRVCLFLFTKSVGMPYSCRNFLAIQDLFPCYSGTISWLFQGLFPGFFGDYFLVIQESGTISLPCRDFFLDIQGLFPCSSLTINLQFRDYFLYIQGLFPRYSGTISWQFRVYFRVIQ